jgi:hypothetical protein
MSSYTMDMYVFTVEIYIEEKTKGSAEKKLAKILKTPNVWDSYEKEVEVFTAAEREDMDHLSCISYPNCDIVGCDK